MTPHAIATTLPYAAIALTIVLCALVLRAGPIATRVSRRAILTASLLLGALPLMVIELAWARPAWGAYVRIARPEAAPLSALVIAYIVVRLARNTASQAAWRRSAIDLTLCLSALSASLAVLGVEAGAPVDNLAVILVVDRSRSIDLVADADARVQAEIAIAERGMHEHDVVGVVAFAAGAVTEDPPRPRGTLRPQQRSVLGRDATDIAAGIRRALAELPAAMGARLVLVSDGVATRGDTLAAAAAAAAAGAPIDALALDQRPVSDVRLVSVRAPARATVREAIELRVAIASPARASLDVIVKRDGELVAHGKTIVEAGEDVVRLTQVAPSSAGLHRYDVEIHADDPTIDRAPEDNSGAVFVRVRGPSRALVIEGDAGKGEPVCTALRNGGFEVESVGATSIPANGAALAAYDLVVLSDVAASDLAPEQIEGFSAYARDAGGGVLLLGGDRSMGPGGYAKTPIEEISPLSFDLRQERRRASLAEVIIIDFSGSMGERVGARTKLDLANEAAARSAALLGPADVLGVAHVDTAVHWTVPLRPLADTTSAVRAIRDVSVGGGGIYVDVALDAAYASLQRENVTLKHALLFADGGDAEQMAGCRAKARAASQAGITTSVVALGKGSDVPELEALSRLGGGRFYLIEDASRLPAVFAQETILAARSAIFEGDFKPSVASPGSALRGIDFSSEPPLRGYVITLPKPRAVTHLTGPDGDPILATWNAGVGRVGAFTSDLKDRWGVAWTSWQGAARLTAQLGRDLARRSDDERVRLATEVAGAQLHVKAIVVGDDGHPETFRRLSAHVLGPDGPPRSVPLEAIAAGTYEALVPLTLPGTYVTTVVDELDGQTVAVTGAVMNAGDELRPTGTDRATLQRIASMTGGKVRDTLAAIFSERPPLRFSYVPLTSPLLLASAFALLASVAARRLTWGDAWKGFTTYVRTPTRARNATAQPTNVSLPYASALQKHKERAIEREPASLRVAAIGAAPPPVAIPPKEAVPPDPRDQPTEPAKTAAEILLARRRARK